MTNRRTRQKRAAERTAAPEPQKPLAPGDALPTAIGAFMLHAAIERSQALDAINHLDDDAVEGVLRSCTAKLEAEMAPRRDAVRRIAQAMAHAVSRVAALGLRPTGAAIYDAILSATHADHKVPIAGDAGHRLCAGLLLQSMRLGMHEAGRNQVDQMLAKAAEILMQPPAEPQLDGEAPPVVN